MRKGIYVFFDTFLFQNKQGSLMKMKVRTKYLYIKTLNKSFKYTLDGNKAR